MLTENRVLDNSKDKGRSRMPNGIGVEWLAVHRMASAGCHLRELIGVGVSLCSFPNRHSRMDNIYKLEQEYSIGVIVRTLSILNRTA